MGTATELQDFLRGWRYRLRADAGGWDLWEGNVAFKELKHTGALRRVRVEEQGKGGGGSGENHFIAQHAIAEICAELADYKAKLGKVRSAEEEFKGLREWLEQQEQRFEKRAAKHQLAPRLRQAIKHVAKEIRGVQRLVIHQHEQAGRSPAGVGVDYYADSVPRIQRPPKREIDLDGRFQERLAVILRSYLRKEDGTTLRTIARLVVLFLICAELAEKHDGELRLHNKRKVSVSLVAKRLRRSRFDEVLK